MTLPLQGVRVVELGRLIAAPWASQMLADFGAEVVKVEDPRGGVRHVIPEKGNYKNASKS